MGQVLLNLITASRIRRFLALSLGIGILIGIGVLLVGLSPNSAGNEGGGDQLALEGVDLNYLADGGILVMEALSEKDAEVSREEAEAIAIASEQPGASIRDALLARVSFQNTERDAWVVSIDPGPYPWRPGPPGGELKYLVALVDATTGEKFLLAGAEGPPPGGWQRY